MLQTKSPTRLPDPKLRFGILPEAAASNMRLTDEVNFDLEDLDDKIKQFDSDGALKRGNHKSADKNSVLLTKANI